MGIIKKFMGSKVVENSMWLMALQVVNTILPMITIPYVTRVLGTSGYGVFSLALNWVSYFQVIVEYGFGYLGARMVSMCKEQEELQRLYSRIITARVLLLCLSFALMNIIYFVSGMSRSHYVCMIIMFCMILGVTFQLTWLFQGKQDMKFITLVNACSQAVSVVLIFVLVKAPNQVYLYCLLYSFTFLFSSVIGIIISRYKYNLKLRFAGVKEAIQMVKEGWSLFISQAMSKIVSGFGITVLGMMVASNVVGAYSAIYKVACIMIILFNPISQALYPHISLEFNVSAQRGLHKVKKISTVIIPLFMLLAVALIIFRRLIIGIALGAEYVSYSDILIPLALWVVCGIINNFLGIQILVASGHQREYSRMFLISAVVSIVLNVVFGYIWRLYGIAWSTFISELCLTILLMYIIRRIYYCFKTE